MTDIDLMMASGANITVAISLEDLRRFHQEVIADTKKELEAQIAEDRGERYLSIYQASMRNVGCRSQFAMAVA